MNPGRKIIYRHTIEGDDEWLNLEALADGTLVIETSSGSHEFDSTELVSALTGRSANSSLRPADAADAADDSGPQRLDPDCIHKVDFDAEGRMFCVDCGGYF